MLFVLEYEREMTATIRREITADNYQATGPEMDQIEFVRGGEAVFMVRRSSVITIERAPLAERRENPAGPVEAAARASALQQHTLQNTLSPAEAAHTAGAR